MHPLASARTLAVAPPSWWLSWGVTPARCGGLVRESNALATAGKVPALRKENFVDTSMNLILLSKPCCLAEPSRLKKKSLHVNRSGLFFRLLKQGEHSAGRHGRSIANNVRIGWTSVTPAGCVPKRIPGGIPKEQNMSTAIPRYLFLDPGSAGRRCGASAGSPD